MSKPAVPKRKSADNKSSSESSTTNNNNKLTEEEFLKHASSISMNFINSGEGKESGKLELKAKKFTTGSLGWGGNTKQVILVNGKKLKCSVSVNFVIEGSKEKPPAKKGKHDDEEENEENEEENDD